VPTAFDEPRVTITHLRVRGYTPDRLLARLRLENLLGTADLYATGLPPAAILCVRHLPDPLPGAVRLNGYSTRPPPHWEQALAVSLADLARHAARPLREAVPASADAVLFADRAEMLACLALDWANATLAYRWWWRNLLRASDINRVVWSAWLDAPQVAPAAFAHLAARGVAEDIVQQMDEAVVITLLKQILGVFNLGDLERSFQENTTADDETVSDSGMPPVKQKAHSAAADETGTAPSPPPAKRIPAPWAACVSESLADRLTMTRQGLLGVALSLMRDPVRVRTASFAREARHWFKAETARVAKGAMPIATQARRNHGINAAAPDEMSVDGDDSAHSVPTRAPEPAQPHPTSAQTQAITPLTAALQSPDSAVEADDAPSVSVMAMAASEPATEPEIEPETAIVTAFGGLFYLLNLAVSLGFYGDFSSPTTRALELSIWDFVACVGAELLGEMPPDPIWALLAGLAGRDEAEPPGISFTPPDAWRIDPTWLSAFPETEALGWSAAGGRLRVKHPSGFLVADLPLEGEPLLQVEALCAVYGADYVTEVANLSAPVDVPPLRRWLDGLMPYIRARLRRALGMTDGDDPAPLLCQHPACVFVTPVQVDIMLNLNTLPIEIRLAGLDRNPGWLPAAGRTVTFHFEADGN